MTVVKAGYLLNGTNSFSYYSFKDSRDLDSIRCKLEEFYKEMEINTDNHYELKSLEIVSKYVVDLEY